MKANTPFDGPLVGDSYEIRIQSGETWIDEVLATGQVHLEQMDEDSFWLGISLPDGKFLHVNLYVEDGKLLTNGWIE